MEIKSGSIFRMRMIPIMSDSIESTEQSSKYLRMMLARRQETHVTHICLPSRLLTAQSNTLDGGIFDQPQTRNCTRPPCDEFYYTLSCRIDRPVETKDLTVNFHDRLV